MRPEYNATLLKNGTRGKYVERFLEGHNLVRLAPDVAAVFPTDEAVNEALRLVIRVAQSATHLAQQARGAGPQ